jgi:hypothetical protein
MMAPSSSSTLKRERENNDDAQDASKKSKEAPKTSASKSSSIPEVQELLTHLHREPSDGGTWSQALDKHFSRPAFARLAQFVAQERYVPTRKRAAAIISFLSCPNFSAWITAIPRLSFLLPKILGRL